MVDSFILLFCHVPGHSSSSGHHAVQFGVTIALQHKKMTFYNLLLQGLIMASSLPDRYVIAARIASCLRLLQDEVNDILHGSIFLNVVLD